MYTSFRRRRDKRVEEDGRRLVPWREIAGRRAGLVPGESYEGGSVGARARAQSQATASSSGAQQQRDTAEKGETEPGDPLTKFSGGAPARSDVVIVNKLLY